MRARTIEVESDGADGESQSGHGQYPVAQAASDEVKPEDRQASPGIFTNSRGNLKVRSPLQWD
jgi:hypothetical protein